MSNYRGLSVSGQRRTPLILCTNGTLSTNLAIAENENNINLAADRSGNVEQLDTALNVQPYNFVPTVQESYAAISNSGISSKSTCLQYFGVCFRLTAKFYLNVLS